MRPPLAALAHADRPVEAWVPAGLPGTHGSGPAPQIDAGERNTCRDEADTAGPETHLEVLEAY